MTRVRIVVATLAVLTLIAVPATANHLVVTDPDDTAGRLDIRKVEASGLVRPIRVVTTQLGWTNLRIEDAGFFLVLYDTFGTARFDYYVLVGSAGRRLQTTLWRDFKGRPDRLVGGGSSWRPADQPRRVAIRVSFEQMRIGADRQTYRWAAQSLLTSDTCTSVCIDRAPNRDSVVEPLPKELQAG